MQFFIALTFDENSLHYQKIDNFRKRFDYKSGRSSLVLMTLLSPFHFVQNKLSATEYDKIIECLRDDLDNFMSGPDRDFRIEFNGFDFAAGKKGVVYLKPRLPDELFFFQETALDFLQESGAIFNRDEKGMKFSEKAMHTFLPIGRGDDQDLLQRAVEKARHEFMSPFHLKTKSVMLFEKKPGLWLPRVELYRFLDQQSDNVKSAGTFLMSEPADSLLKLL